MFYSEFHIFIQSYKSVNQLLLTQQQPRIEQSKVIHKKHKENFNFEIITF